MSPATEPAVEVVTIHWYETTYVSQADDDDGLDGDWYPDEVLTDEGCKDIRAEDLEEGETLADAVAEYLYGEGAYEPSSWPSWTPRTWYTATRTDDLSGDSIQTSYHLSMSETDSRRVYEIIKHGDAGKSYDAAASLVERRLKSTTDRGAHMSETQTAIKPHYGVTPNAIMAALQTLGSVTVWLDGGGAEIDCPNGDQITIFWKYGMCVASRRREGREILHAQGLDISQVCARLRGVGNQRLSRARSIITQDCLWRSLGEYYDSDEHCPIGDESGGGEPDGLSQYMIVLGRDNDHAHIVFADTLQAALSRVEALVYDDIYLLGMWDLDAPGEPKELEIAVTARLNLAAV